jgi:hypothetical protein
VIGKMPAASKSCRRIVTPYKIVVRFAAMCTVERVN